MNDKHKPRAPWDKRSEELRLRPENRHWADYMAWEEWFDKEYNRGINGRIDHALDCLETLDKIVLYGMMCDLICYSDKAEKEE